MNTVEISKLLLVRFGTSWVLWLLFGLSVAALAVIVERWLLFRSKREDVQALARDLDAHLETGTIDGALAMLDGRQSTAAAVARAGLKLAGRGAAVAERGMDSTMAVERSVLDARLAYLGTLGNNAPFVGLFGTVIGVILAFEELGRAPGGGASATASAAVMSAIAEALVTTAVGIAVALPAVAAYNYFQRRIAAILADADALASLVGAHLTSMALRSVVRRRAELEDDAPARARTEPVQAARRAL